MFCPTCGTQNPDTVSVCTACARPIMQVDLNPAPGQPQSEHNVTPPPPPPPMPPGASAHAMAAAASAPAVAAPPRVYPPLYVTPPAQPKTMSVIGKIGIVAVVLFAILFAVAVRTPDLPNEAQAVG